MKRILSLVFCLCLVMSCDKVPPVGSPLITNPQKPDGGDEPGGDPQKPDDPGKPDNPDTIVVKKDLPAAFSVGSAAFDASGGHIQGIAATEDALYLTQATRLVKVDWTGKVLYTKIGVRHTGDICWWNGRLYAAIAITEGDDENTPGKGSIMVFNDKLQMVQEVDIDRRVDGIACMDGILYVGMGSKALPSSIAHRVNILGRFDAKTLKEVGERAEFDYGYETTYGFQDMTSDGQYVYASFYGVGDAPCIVAFDKDLNIIKTYNYSASNGLDIMPSAFKQDKPTYIKATSKIISSPKAVSCSLSYWIPE